MKILIPKYGEYQHYGKRRPPWIKLHKKLLDDHKFFSLKAEHQMLLICLWLLASENPLEEGYGVVEVTRTELHWRLRGMNLKGLDSLKSNGFIVVEDASDRETPHASTALARRLPQRETEGETEAEAETEGPPAEPAGVPAKKSWAREAAEDWDAHFGKGSSAPGRIGAALSPLVKAHGWARVRPVWQRYIEEKDPQFASPQDFQSKFRVWAEGLENRVGGRAIENENRRELGRFLEGEQKRLPSEPTSAKMTPAKGST